MPQNRIYSKIFANSGYSPRDLVGAHLGVIQTFNGAANVLSRQAQTLPSNALVLPRLNMPRMENRARKMKVLEMK